MGETKEEREARWKRIADEGGPILRPVGSYYDRTPRKAEPSKLQYCQATLEDRIVFFVLTAAQSVGQGEQTVPIHWEVGGQVFIGELSLDDVLSLDIEPERSRMAG